MLILEIISNDERGVLFKSKKGMILVPKNMFEPGGEKGYRTGVLQAVDDDFWDKLERNGQKQYVS